MEEVMTEGDEETEVRAKEAKRTFESSTILRDSRPSGTRLFPHKTHVRSYNFCRRGGEEQAGLATDGASWVTVGWPPRREGF
ncbi:unnamed protein product [Boreogadus saida]